MYGLGGNVNFVVGFSVCKHLVRIQLDENRTGDGFMLSL